MQLIKANINYLADKVSNIIGSSEDISCQRDTKNAHGNVIGEPAAIVNQVDSITENTTLLETTPEDVLSAGSHITKSEMFLPEIRVRKIYILIT